MGTNKSVDFDEDEAWDPSDTAAARYCMDEPLLLVIPDSNHDFPIIR